jgi:hypothetical protein
MKLSTKFNANDSVWFFDSANVKFLQGTIVDAQSWDKWAGFRYEISHVQQNGNTMTYNVEESKIYATKEEILAGLFEENGTPVQTA